MERRTLLKSALALPAAGVEVALSAGPANSVTAREEVETIHSGLAGLDFALGGIERGALIAVTGPPCAGKTLLLLELAARVSSRYRQNVAFYSAQEPAVYLAGKAAQRGDVTVAFGMESLVGESAEPAGNAGPAILLMESTACAPGAAFGLAKRLRESHTWGCALLIMDGFSSYPESAPRVSEIDGIQYFPADRWAHDLLEAAAVLDTRRWAAVSGVPLVVGLTTPSLVEPAGPSEAECALRVTADRYVVIHRPEIYRETAKKLSEERDVACLTGTSAQWWDTRSSRLRFRSGDLTFETVV